MKSKYILKNQLLQYLDAGYPILYIHSFEEIKTDSIIRSAINQRKAIEWNGADGLVDFDTKNPNSLEHEYTDPETALCELREDIHGNLDRRLLILKDILPHLENPRVIAQLKQICHEIENGLESTIIIVAPLIVIPKELEKFITILEMPYLSENEISAQIQSFADDYKEFINEQLKERMSIAFKGLSEFEIENLLASSLATHGEFCEQNLSLILEQKRQMMMKLEGLDKMGEVTTAGIGGLVGASVGGKIGATVGAAVGTLLGPVGTIIGGIVGGAVGGIVGYAVGSSIGQKIYQGAKKVAKAAVSFFSNGIKKFKEKLSGQRTTLSGKSTVYAT